MIMNNKEHILDREKVTSFIAYNNIIRPIGYPFTEGQ